MSFIPTPTITSDYYKETHFEHYPASMTKLVSYLTPRMSRVTEQELIFFGLQYFIKDFLQGTFNEKFFGVSKEKAIAKYARIMKYTMGERFADTTRWEKLWDLGYLPLEIKAVPEGTKVPMHCPMVEISNTNADFVWLVNYIETAMSCTMWHTMCSANIGYKYRQIANKWYAKTVDDTVPVSTAIGDFSMRGQESIESATKSSAAFLLSFRNTATIPAIEFLEDYYNANVENEIVGCGLASTEHSVMCSNTAIDGNEHDFVKKLLTVIYPQDNFTMVSDSYDYWGMFDILAMEDIKQAVLAHNGFIGIRGDSGDPVEILCGLPINNGTKAAKGTVELLDGIFGHTINSKGYKVLNSHVKAIYGDSITPERAELIYDILEQKGYAANCVSLGMGSYSLQASEGNTPTTRDTFSIAVKSTYGEYKDDDGTIKPLMIFKNPKTDTGHFKKSQKGCCVVTQSDDGTISFTDGHTWASLQELDYQTNMLHTVFKDGLLTNPQSLSEIRSILNDGKF